MIGFRELYPRGLDLVGCIPEFFDEADLRPARVQIDDRYVSGWRPTRAGIVVGPDLSLSIEGYPQAFQPMAEARLRDETILIYPRAWVMIMQPDGSYEVAHVD
jgi:hypothetical protein